MICDATLVFQLTTARGALPVQGAGILVTDPATGRNTYLTTDPSGRSRVLCVTAPPLAWSQSPESDGRPYSIYHADIRAAGYVPVRLTGIQVFAGQQSLQVVEMVPCEAGAGAVPPDMTIGRPRDPLEEGERRFSEAPQGDDQPPGAEGQGPVPAVRESLREEDDPGGPAPLAGPGEEQPEQPAAVPVLAAAQPVDPPETRSLAQQEALTGPRAASQVYVPQYITVHLGAPGAASARHVPVSFRDYAKSVASSEK